MLKCHMGGESLDWRDVDGEGGAAKVGEAWKKKGQGEMRARVWCMGGEGIHRHGRRTGMGPWERRRGGEERDCGQAPERIVKTRIVERTGPGRTHDSLVRMFLVYHLRVCFQ